MEKKVSHSFNKQARTCRDTESKNILFLVICCEYGFLTFSLAFFLSNGANALMSNRPRIRL